MHATGQTFGMNGQLYSLCNGMVELFMDIVYHPKSKALDLECIKELVFQSLDIQLFIMIHEDMKCNVVLVSQNLL